MDPRTKKILQFTLGIVVAAIFIGASVAISVYASHLALIIDPILVGLAIACLGISARAMGFRLRAEPLRVMNNKNSYAHELPAERPYTGMEYTKTIYTVTDQDKLGTVHTESLTQLHYRSPQLVRRQFDSLEEVRLPRRHSFP